MAQKLKLGIIGLSEGNGHPYSWSAIFNGYDKNEIIKCPFPVIPEYLSKETYPENFLTELAEVTHIWTQESALSHEIAKATKIVNVCNRKEEMIGQIDALLLARDDAENHYLHAEPFLKAGVPIYIDKPFALTLNKAKKLWDASSYENQIFSCSALQFAKEFQPDIVDKKRIGEVKAVWASIPKSWDKYAVHIIEPTLNILPRRGTLLRKNKLRITNNQLQGVQVEWDTGIIAQFQTTGNLPSPLAIRILGEFGYQDLMLIDTFYAFKAALHRFIEVVKGEKPTIPRKLTMEMIEILETGR